MKSKKLSTSMLIACLAALSVITTTIYLSYLSQRHFETTLISQIQQQLLTIAKSTARGLEEFIAEYAKDLNLLSRNPFHQEELYRKILHNKLYNEYCPLKDFYEVHKNEIDALTALDANGIMLHRHPFIENRPGMDKTDKPGVASVLREHKPNVSEVFYNNLGNPAISISEPVFYKGEFAGMVRWMIQIDTISKRFVLTIKPGKKGFAILLDEKGRFLSHPIRNFESEPFPVFFAKNRNTFPDLDWSGVHKMAEERSKGKEGVAVVYCPVKGKAEGANKIIKRITGYAPVRIGSRTWSITVNIPYSELAGPINIHARNTFGLAGIVILLFGAGGVAFFRIRKKKAELETEAKYLKQIANGAVALRESERRLKKYSVALEEARNNLEQKVAERTKELKEVQDALVRNERLAALGQLAGSVGHELRNPLGVIKNAGYFLNMKIDTIENDAVKENIDIINRETNIAAKIITDLLDFARIKEPERREVDINQLVTDTLSRSLIAEHFKVITDFSDDIPPVSIDPLQVSQVFLNLIENAAQAMEEGGILTISTRATDGATEAVFADEGRGIPESNLEKIFEPLFTTKTRGIGLGLSISKSLAKANGADILVESEEGKGSRFTVRFED